jgi:hypothetical protein
MFINVITLCVNIFVSHKARFSALRSENVDIWTVLGISKHVDKKYNTYILTQLLHILNSSSQSLF